MFHYAVITGQGLFAGSQIQLVLYRFSFFVNAVVFVFKTLHNLMLM